MNLKEFLNYRQDCPMCDSKLVFSFHSSKHQKIRYEDNRLLVLFDLNGIKKKHIDYKVGYSFGLEDSSFYIEFYTKDEKRFENDSPLFLIDRFKELDKNLKGYRMYKGCISCRLYWYSSGRLDLYYKKARLTDIEMEKEYFGMTQNMPDGKVKIFKLMNFHQEEESSLNCFYAASSKEALSDYSIPANATQLLLPLIQFTSKEETMERIKKLIIFS